MSWNWHITVACLVQRDGRFLLVEERIDDAGGLVLNQPAGHWDENETLFEAAARETLEESAWEVRPDALVGIYAYQPDNLDYGFLRLAFAATALRHHPGRTLDSGIARAVWLTREELAACPERHRSPMVLQGVDDYLAGKRHPLELVAHLR